MTARADSQTFGTAIGTEREPPAAAGLADNSKGQEKPTSDNSTAQQRFGETAASFISQSKTPLSSQQEKQLTRALAQRASGLSPSEAQQAVKDLNAELKQSGSGYAFKLVGQNIVLQQRGVSGFSAVSPLKQ